METPLQDWELDSLRASFQGTLMRTTAQWQRPVSARTKGGQSRTYVALANIACAIEAATTTSREVSSGDGQKSEQWWEVTVAADLTVQPTDRFVVLLSGNVYEAVEGDGDPTSAFTNIVRCRRLTSFATPYLLPGTVSAVGTVKTATIV
jgi:hypothetical protein